MTHQRCGRILRHGLNAALGVVAAATMFVVGVASGQGTDDLDPGLVGKWDPPFPLPVTAVHIVNLPPRNDALLHTGRLLFWDFNGASATLWRYPTNQFVPVPFDDAVLFCAGHSLTASGDVLVAGGLFSGAEASIFRQATETWEMVDDMNYGRFYPTLTTLGRTGQILSSAGSADPGARPELYTVPFDIWTALPDSAQLALPYYPFMYQLPDGDIFFAGPDIDTYVLDPDTWSWRFVDASGFAGGSSAMYLPGVVLKTGADGGILTEVIDLRAPGPVIPQWQQVGSMRYGRTNLNLTILPDGDVLAVGGSDTQTGQPVHAAELFDTANAAWKTMASMQEDRLYHSTAILLPDARVLAAGSNGNYTGEIYSPPYLFHGARPNIRDVGQIGYGEDFVIVTGEGEGASIRRVALVGHGAVTHAFDQHQRYVPLRIIAVDGDRLKIAAPANSNVAPSGFYMLFILNDRGVPSHARYVKAG